ncbi:MAG: DUF86 domain-containing protein [Phycisphaera sp.]|nr:DUF86 domain-containing protein [Phycisphaera sp.]
MVNAIRVIHTYTSGRSYEEVVSDPQCLDAVLYRFSILGEAANHVPTSIMDDHPEIPWRDTRAMRNIVTHVHFGIRLEKVWETLQNDLTQLQRQVLRIMHDLPPA